MSEITREEWGRSLDALESVTVSSSQISNTIGRLLKLTDEMKATIDDIQSRLEQQERIERECR